MLKAELLEQPQARVVVGEDETEQSLQAESRRVLDRLGEKRVANSFALTIRRDVYAQLSGRMIRWASVKRLKAEPSGNDFVVNVNPEWTRAWIMFMEPIVPAFNGYPLGVRGGDTASDCRVVDRDDCRKVSFFGIANRHAGGSVPGNSGSVTFVDQFQDLG